jgi:hypothetical protein
MRARTRARMLDEDQFRGLDVAVDKPSQVTSNAVRDIRREAAEIGKHWPELPVARKRAVLTSLIERIEVRVDRIDLRLRPPRLAALREGAERFALPPPPAIAARISSNRCTSPCCTEWM